MLVGRKQGIVVEQSQTHAWDSLQTVIHLWILSSRELWDDLDMPAAWLYNRNVSPPLWSSQNIFITHTVYSDKQLLANYAGIVVGVRGSGSDRCGDLSWQ